MCVLQHRIYILQSPLLNPPTNPLQGEILLFLHQQLFSGFVFITLVFCSLCSVHNQNMAIIEFQAPLHADRVLFQNLLYIIIYAGDVIFVAIFTFFTRHLNSAEGCRPDYYYYDLELHSCNGKEVIWIHSVYFEKGISSTVIIYGDLIPLVRT